MILKKIEPATSDERGSISDILYNTSFQHAAIIESKQAGVVRGNHYHKLTTQSVLVLKGRFRYWWQPVDQTQPAQSVLVGPNDLVTSPPNEIHAMEMLEPNTFIVFSSGPRGGQDYESDTFRVPSIVPDKKSGF
jgi:dTDP-4-dehydrorhamnose 3,5-epimerase-like enzyme